MLNRLLKAFSALVCVASLQVIAAPSDNPVFYQVNYQGEQAYLLGSVHVGKADFYPLNAKIEQAFADSDALVIEADVTKADVGSLLAKHGQITPSQKAKTDKILQGYCQPQMQLCQAISGFAPWLQASQIGLLRFAQLGFQAEQGVDLTLVARNGDKDLIELESVEFQFELISSFSEQTQYKMVEEAAYVEDVEMLALIAAWRKGDDKQLAKLMEDPQAVTNELLDKLLWQRNHTMAAKIKQLMIEHKGKQLFIVVGAGHLVGQQAIPGLLNTKGMQLKACHRNEC
ncbi:TraB/GumN family protein [Shewanella maritima]|uniref:TraB/GumN family protein n=1 Tax=Shewanella maritima TaxID=2520507 RepID=A0A411PGI1_9GAMM|nr:TraB/GumN family protein [Shewanella maritima]QBF82490.1 TraB/GumN family protein [Shewanella maritima]